MDIKRAKELLETLADGVNPLTGEILPDDDVCNQPDIIRALHLAVAQLDRKAKQAESLPENAGKPWSAEDDRTLSAMFDKGCSEKELSVHFKRTRGAISSRLERLGKI